jgi:hypothetical protein
MILTVSVHSEGATRPVPGSPVRVQVRDTGIADAPAVVVAEASGVVRQGPGDCLDIVALSVGNIPRHATIWVHVDVDRDGRVTKGDYVTTASYPIQPDREAGIRVTVKLV